MRACAAAAVPGTSRTKCPATDRRRRTRRATPCAPTPETTRGATRAGRCQKSAGETLPTSRQHANHRTARMFDGLSYLVSSLLCRRCLRVSVPLFYTSFLKRRAFHVLFFCFCFSEIKRTNKNQCETLKTSQLETNCNFVHWTIACVKVLLKLFTACFIYFYCVFREVRDLYSCFVRCK